MAQHALSVSVVVATFNGEAFIEGQLASILGQTLLPTEIVVTDDGSTDATLDVVQKARNSSPESVSWRVITRKKPVGVAENLRRGVEAATSPLVALSDQDDWFAPTKLEKLAGYFAKKPSLLLVHSDAELVDGDGRLLGQTLSHTLRMTGGERRGLIAGRALAQLVRRNLVTGHTVMMRPGLADGAGRIPPGWLHDEWWALVAAAQEAMVCCPEVLGHYRQHEVNQVGATRSGWQRLMERFHEAQGSFRERHRVRHEGLEYYLDQHRGQLPSESEQLLRGRIAHYRWQAGLSATRFWRIGPIVGKLLAGHYHRYRRGVFDALRDLFQPGN